MSTSASRFAATFDALRAKKEGAFVPFIMLNDPSPEESVEIISAVVDAGADAVELGVPFSDPVADGPAIQRAHVRALDGGSTVAKALDVVRTIRSRYPALPIGMLVYVNVAFVRGLDTFYREFHDAGADAVLLPDVPVREGRPFDAAAADAGIDPIYIAPAKASPEVLRGVAAHSTGYIYAISRDGVTGTEREASVEGLREVVENVRSYGGPPVLLGFGISKPEHVSAAIEAGAAGAITGSAISRIIDRHTEGEHPLPGHVTDMAALKEDLTSFVRSMKEATIAS